MNNEKLNEMAEEYFEKTGRVPTEWAVMNFMAGAESVLNLPEVKAMKEALAYYADKDNWVYGDEQALLS